MARLPDETLLDEIKCISVRARNGPRYEYNIRTVGELREKTDAELLRIPNFGMKTLRELREAIGDLEPQPPREADPYTRIQRIWREVNNLGGAHILKGTPKEWEFYKRLLRERP